MMSRITPSPRLLTILLPRKPAIRPTTIQAMMPRPVLSSTLPLACARTEGPMRRMFMRCSFENWFLSDGRPEYAFRVDPPSKSTMRATGAEKSPQKCCRHPNEKEPAARSAPSSGRISNDRSVPIVLALVRAVDRHADVLRLLGRELRQLHAELREVQPRDFFVEVLRQ